MYHKMLTKQAFCLLGLLLTGACTTVRAAPVELTGLEAFAQPCPTEPPVLSDAEVLALVETMPSSEQRERQFWAPRDQDHRACALYERARADALLALGARHNQIIRESSRR
jgi:hypothetical protein